MSGFRRFVRLVLRAQSLCRNKTETNHYLFMKNIQQPLIRALISLLLIGAACQLLAQDAKPTSGSKAFEQLKKLLGKWEGTIDVGQGPMKCQTRYKLTAGGSAIMETCFEGSPMEMITIYHDNKEGELTLTHYCMLGNQPKMVLKSAKQNELKFALSEDADIKVSNETHMNAVTIKLDGQNKMTQLWTKFEEGEAANVELNYQRTE